MAEGASNKDVIYIDVDDEITAIIDKVRSSKRQIVALVIPKRSAVLQSIVNMKLLKRTADSAKKNIVLITGDEGLLPLAGSVGMHVARNLQSRPEIPQGPPPADLKPEVAEESAILAGNFDDQPIDTAKTLGELSGDEGDIELDNTANAPEKPTEDDRKKKGKKSKKNKALLVPNFNRFRSWLVLGACFIVVFIVLLFIALTALPKAAITINTNSQTVPSNLQITLGSSNSSANVGADVIPAQSSQTQKTYTGTATTTGQQNNGTAASGDITMVAQECSPPFHKPASISVGSAASSNGLTFITQEQTTFSNSGSPDSSGCIDFSANNPTTVTAQNPGSKYNLSSAAFTVGSGVTATGTTSGGTDQIVQIVAQADITSAQNKINTDGNAIKSQLESDLQSQGLFPIQATFSGTTPTPTPNTAVGQPANSVTVTESITYSMYGVKRSDLQAVIAANVNTQISTTSQKILDYGISSATFSSQGQGSGSVVVTIQDSALVGFALDESTIKKKAAGQKPGSAEQMIRGYSGVKSVSVHLSPFWVTSIPKSSSKITVKIVNPKS